MFCASTEYYTVILKLFIAYDEFLAETIPNFVSQCTVILYRWIVRFKGE